MKQNNDLWFEVTEKKNCLKNRKEKKNGVTISNFIWSIK